jgi:hypothetical protein
MVRFVDEPTEDEFAQLMNEHRFPLHFDNGESSDEHYIASYPKTGSTKAGVLTVGHWYLAHILGVNEGYLCPVDFNAMCPRGKLSDWTQQGNFKVRKIAGKFPGNKNLIVAHFLRFIDPLNYYVIPGKNYQDNHSYRFKNNQIGEYTVLNDYVAARYRQIYGTAVMDKFRDNVFAPPLHGNDVGQCAIDITYGPDLAKSNTPKGKKTLVELEAEYSRDKLIEVAAFYLCNNVGLKKLEVKLQLTEALGFEASNILQVLGINTSGSYKGLLRRSNIDDAIGDPANAELKNTLNEIKARGLHLKP